MSYQRRRGMGSLGVDFLPSGVCPSQNCPVTPGATYAAANGVTLGADGICYGFPGCSGGSCQEVEGQYNDPTPCALAELQPNICALLAAGYLPSNPANLVQSTWTTADGVTTDPLSFVAVMQAENPGYVAPTGCAMPTVAASLPAQPAQPCPTGWSGTYPDCVPPSTLPSTTTYSNPPGTVVTNPYGSTVVNSSGATQQQTSTSSTSGSTSSSSTASWFTDPTQEIISGILNWELVAGAGALVVLLMMMGGKR